MTNNELNELMVNQETEEIVNQTPNAPIVMNEEIVQDTSEYTVYKQPNGKFRKEMKYKQYASYIPETQEEKVALYKVLHSQDESVKRMANHAGLEFEIHEVFINPYQKFDEETGKNENGVTCTIKTEDGYIATSSKTVYYNLINLFNVFGYPDNENYEPIKVKVQSTRQMNGNQISIVLV